MFTLSFLFPYHFSCSFVDTSLLMLIVAVITDELCEDLCASI